LRLVRPNTTATLYFALVVDGRSQNYELSLTIFRIIGSGFGCGFENVDPQTIARLQELASSLNPQAITQSAEDLAASQARFSKKFVELKKPLSELVSTAADKMCIDFLAAVDNALFLGARDAGNNVDEGHFLDGQNEIRSRADDISIAVPKMLFKGVSILNSPLSLIDDDPDPDQPVSISELSLVDKDEFEDFLTLAQLISDLEPRFKRELYELDCRFSLLANREVDERSNPIGPAVVGGIFAEELKNLRSEQIAINVIYRSLGKVLELNLAFLYEDANKLLVDFGILPVVDKEKSKFKRPPGSETNQPTPQDVLEETAGEDANLHYPEQGAAHYGQAPHPAARAAPAPPLQPILPGAPPPGGGGFDVIDPTAQVGAPINPSVGYATPMAPGAQHSAAGQPGMVAPGGGYQGGPQNQSSVSAGNVQPGQLGAGTPGSVQGGSMRVGGLEATFGGFGTGPAVYVPPTLQQAYSAAQTQMALRRDLLPVSASEAIAIGAVGLPFAPAQIIDGLTHLQQSEAQTRNAEMLSVQGIKQRIVEAITASSGAVGSIGQMEGDAVEVIANLFNVLVEDALLTDTAKSQLTKLQVPVQKTALMDPDFFEATDHPVRQLLNRVSMLRDGSSDSGIERNARASELIDRINAEFARDPEVLRPIVSEFDNILRDQRQAFDDNVAAVVGASEEQEKVLSQRRDKNLEATDSSVAQRELPEEWNRWLDRGKLLETDERLVMNANTNKPYLVTLVWVGPEFNPFVFVDDKGDKSSTLTLQQVAMYLRRGTLKQLLGEDVAPVDRALFGVVNRMHGEVEVRATHDELTDFMNRKSFLQSIERQLPADADGTSNPVLCHIAIDNLKAINDEYGIEAGDALISSVAEILQTAIGHKRASFGRLGGSEIGILWHKGGLQNAYKKLRSCFKGFADRPLDVEGQDVIATAFSGITAVEDGLTSPEQLLTVVADACAIAKSTNEKPIYVVGSENKFREQLEQMVSYIGKAFDRERLVLLHQSVNSLTGDAPPALHVVLTAEDRNGKLIPPDFFEQALVNSDRAFEVDQWRLKKSFRWMANNSDDLDNYAAVIIPLANAAVKRDDLANLIITELMETAVPPGKVFFEITDKDAVANVAETAELVRTLKEFGCRFILDEFGSGQGNYDYVNELAVDFVTIDSRFIGEAAQNQNDFAMAKSINELVHFMGKKTIGKPAANTDVCDVLRDIGVDFVYDKCVTNRVEL
jgi:diguanylate cyclase (GGDEF)-like protein